MAYYEQDQLEMFGFKFLGDNVKISTASKVYDAENISIGSNSRIDDFCIISGNVEIGSYCHITPMCLVAGGQPGIRMEDFVTLAYGVKVFAQSDDYSGETMVNSTIPKKYKSEYFAPVILEKQVIIGANATVMPGVTLREGTSVGAMSLVRASTSPWGIYVGIPARHIKNRSRRLLALEKEFLNENTL